MKLSTRLKASVAVSASVFGVSTAQAEIQLAESDGWQVTSDGRVNAFVSHVFGDNRPEGVSNLNWVGFNESTVREEVAADGSLTKTRIRSGYVPSTLAFNFRKQMAKGLKVSSRVEVGIQITNIAQSEVADPTWMDPRAVYLDLAGDWGSVRAGRDFGLFGRSNLFMNYELGHGYGLGFPCAYVSMFGGACGHVGFGTIWPDFKAQLTYTTPAIADALNVSVGVFDPRTNNTFNWSKTPLPRVEGEAVLNLSVSESSSLKVWANGYWQTIGTTADVGQIDGAGNPIVDGVGNPVTTPTDFSQDIFGVGGGVQANLGPLRLGAAGHTAKGMDAFILLPFNPIAASFAEQDSHKIDFRSSTAFLLQAAYFLGDSWLSLGFGQTTLDRLDNDGDANMPGSVPILHSQTGISVGLYHRIGQVVLGLDWFNAHYAFDARVVNNPAGDPPTMVEENAQTVNIINSGVTLEW